MIQFRAGEETDSTQPCRCLKSITSSPLPLLHLSSNKYINSSSTLFLGLNIAVKDSWLDVQLCQQGSENYQSNIRDTTGVLRFARHSKEETSRYYRSLEVLLGYQYTTAIDMWSFGYIVAELFLGLPLFPGALEFDLIRKMIKIPGEQPPDYVLKEAKITSKFFKCVGSVNHEDNSQSVYQPLNEEEYEAVFVLQMIWDNNEQTLTVSLDIALA